MTESTKSPFPEITNDTFRAIPGIQKRIEHLRHIIDSGQTDHPASWFDAPVGKEFHLVVTVAEPDLANVVLQSCFSQHALIPGFKVESIVIDPEGQRRTNAVNLLDTLKLAIEQNDPSILDPLFTQN